eukprot:scaffold73937_cov33-Tisochrysis_lutea.AAC.1
MDHPARPPPSRPRPKRDSRETGRGCYSSLPPCTLPEFPHLRSALPTAVSLRWWCPTASRRETSSISRYPTRRPPLLPPSQSHRAFQCVHAPP